MKMMKHCKRSSTDKITEENTTLQGNEEGKKATTTTGKRKIHVVEGKRKNFSPSQSAEKEYAGTMDGKGRRIPLPTKPKKEKSRRQKPIGKQKCSLVKKTKDGASEPVEKEDPCIEKGDVIFH